MEYSQIVIALPLELGQRLDKISESTRCSKRQIVIQALEEWFKTRKKA